MTPRTMCPHPTPAGIAFVACDLPTVPAWMVGTYGSTVDHLDPRCPHIRHRTNVRPTVDRVCPEGSDLCGTCVRRWRAGSGVPFPRTQRGQETRSRTGANTAAATGGQSAPERRRRHGDEIAAGQGGSR